MLSLVGQYKGRALSLNEFMMRSRELLGERLYTQLARDMSNAAAARGVGNNPQAQAQTQAQTQAAPLVQTGIRMATMHSMPQIYSGIQAPGLPGIPFIPQQPQYSQYPHPQTQSQPSQQTEVDVTKMDTSSLQDVMQYSGVDLKAEAELLYREHHDNAVVSGLGSLSVDHRLKFDYFFNPFKFRAIVQHALQRHFFSNTLASTTSEQGQAGKLNKPLGISEEAVHLLGIAIQKRLIGILRKLSEISRHRVDYGRGRFKIKIENDPKKQLWLQEKLFIEGVGEDRRKAAVTTAASASSTTTTNTPATTGVNQTLLNPPSLATIAASLSASAVTNKSTGSIPSKAASASGSGAAGGDDTVKTKLANVTAMAALGIRQKSWMSSATALNTPASASNPTSTSTTTTNTTANSQSSTNDEKEAAEVYQHPLANFYSLPSSTPLTDSELRAQYFNRTIATVDLITCMEADPHLKRSKLLAVLYEALPRENKENNSSESQ